MKIVFASNFYNHHQKPFADALYSAIGSGYHFIETEPISEERLDMGWGGDERPSYILRSYADEASKNQCQRIIDEADVVIYGSAPYSLLKNRLKAGKLTFKYCERPYKKGVPFMKLPVHIFKAYKKYTKFKNFYLLCASAYAPWDFSRMLAFIGKTYKWGYFTALKEYADFDRLIEKKEKNSLLWVARLIELKHPEIALEIAERLKREGYSFTLRLIGNGELEEMLKEEIEQRSLGDCVQMLGAMTPECVREYMERSQIFLFTSDKNEGWGAVLNESLNSGCAVVASHAIGSVPFLIEDGENGFIYQDGNVDDLYQKVKLLLDREDLQKALAKNAYATMKDEWNAQNAAEKFISLCEKMLAGEYKPFPYESGVCSKANILSDHWIK